MSKLNKKNISAPRVEKAPYGLAVSGNGNVQYKKGPQNILFETVVSTLYGADSYYETANDKVVRMRESLAQTVKTHGLQGVEYAGRVALFAREHMNIRTMPIVMVVELAKLVQLSRKTGTAFDYNLRGLVAGVISRADELTDLYAYALKVFGTSQAIPMAVRRGVADAFNKFDAYQFGKYNRQEGLTLRNLLRIVHPEPVDEKKSEIFAKIMAETLEAPYTWEVELSKNGQLGAEQKSKKDLWTELIMREGSGSIGYMALLRNLRNMKEAGIDDKTWKVVAAKISNPKAVEKSKQLPFGFINAYDISKEAGVPSLVLNAIRTATELALSNMPKLGDRVWIITDCSGSMGTFGYGFSAGRNSNANTPIKIAAILSAVLAKAAKDSFQFKMTLFSDYAIDVDLDPSSSVFTLYEQIMSKVVGGGTNLGAALAKKPQLGFEPDTVFVLSDMEVNQLSSHQDPNRYFTNDCVKVAMNLAGRDSTPLGEHKGWTQLSGFSTKVFQYVDFTRKADSIVEKLFMGELITVGEKTDSEE